MRMYDSVSFEPFLFSAERTSMIRPLLMFSMIFLRLATTCSIVGLVRLIDTRIVTTMMCACEIGCISMRISRASRPASGAKSTSASWGYCESHEISAPRSIMPCWISTTMPNLSCEYWYATLTSGVVDMKASSTPPLTPCSLGYQNVSGKRRPAMPRKTGFATVSLPILTMQELMTWIVVVYMLSSLRTLSYVSAPLASSHFCAVPMYFSYISLGVTSETMSFLRNVTGESSPRSTPLYLTKSGPVYRRPPMTSKS